MDMDMDLGTNGGNSFFTNSIGFCVTNDGQYWVC